MIGKLFSGCWDFEFGLQDFGLVEDLLSLYSGCRRETVYVVPNGLYQIMSIMPEDEMGVSESLGNLSLGS